MTQYPILVYGTLRPSCGNYEWALKGETIFEQDVTLEGFTMYGSTGFPYLTKGDSTVTATLIYIKDESYVKVMQDLDGLEGYHGEGDRANLYDRTLHNFEIDGLHRQAWIYVAAPHVQSHVERTVPVLEGGDWVKHVRNLRNADYVTTI